MAVKDRQQLPLLLSNLKYNARRPLSPSSANSSVPHAAQSACQTAYTVSPVELPFMCYQHTHTHAHSAGTSMHSQHLTKARRGRNATLQCRWAG